MTYAKIKYYENGNIKSIEVHGIFLDFNLRYPLKGNEKKEPLIKKKC